MAITDIYPYGQAEEMPVGYPIANDLDTDSAQQALSAGQGKRIGDWIRTSYEEIDLSKIPITNAFIISPGSGEWDGKWSNPSGYSCILVPVGAGEKYRIYGGNNPLRYAVLQDNGVNIGSFPNYATGFTAVVSLTVGSEETLTIPENGSYLYVDNMVNSNQRTPSVDKIHVAESIEDVKHYQGVQSNGSIAKKEIVVAAYNAPAWQSKNADFICDGTNDEVELQQAIDLLSSTGGRIRLTSGDFYIDAFPNDRFAYKTYTDNESGDSHRYAALMLPQSGVSYEITGDVIRRKGTGGTKIMVTDTLYSSLGANDLRVMFAAQVPSKGADQINNNVNLTMSLITFAIPWNQKPIMCLDMMFVARVYLQYVTCNGYIVGSAASNGATVSNVSPIPKAVQHCVGLRSTGGSNSGSQSYTNMQMTGFYEGYKFGGEHIHCVNLGSGMNVYGYTFGNFTYTHCKAHPITLINCSDEQSFNGPYFALNPEGQAVYFIGFNMEIGNSYVTGGEGHGPMATEKTPGTWHGMVQYTIVDGDDNASPRVPWANKVYTPFWEDGHGHGFISRNMAHLPACSTSVRNTYKPDYLERIWDTTLNKEAVCVDTANKVWKDAAGNTV